MEILKFLPQNRLVFSNNLENLRCIICHEIPLFPLECSSCQNLFCENCVETWKKIRNSCPIQCKNGDFIVNSSHKTLKNTIISLRFSCENEVFGCEFIDNFMKVLIHERKKCDFIQVSCVNHECKEVFLKKNKEKHEKICEFQEFFCGFCGEKLRKYEEKEHNCIEILRKNVENLKKKLENSSVFLGKLEEKLFILKEGDKEKKCEDICEKAFNYQYKDLKSVIRKQISKEITKKKQDLLRILPENLNISMKNDEYLLKTELCCENSRNLQWMMTTADKKCEICMKNSKNKIRFFCKICEKCYCLQCKKISFFNEKCPLLHKFVNINNIVDRIGKECCLCQKNEGILKWDKKCQLVFCEVCFKTKEK